MPADAPVSEESIARVQTASRPRRDPVRVAVKNDSPQHYRGDLVTVGVFSDSTLSSAAKAIDKAGKGMLSGVLKRGDLDGVGSSLVLHDAPGTSAARLMLLSAGRQGEFSAPAFRKVFEGAARALSTGAARHAAVALTDLEVPGRSAAWHVQHATRLIVDGAYHFEPPATTNGHVPDREHGARDIDLLVPGKVTRDLEHAVLRGQAIAEGMALARDLGNLPGNICNPPYLAAAARTLGREFRFDVEVLERHDMEKLGMGAALAVGRASAQPCKFIVMNYSRGGQSRPVVLVGKGVTFDSGGISLKPGADMDEMKFDMCGAAAVFGAMKVVARLALPLNVVAIVPAVENMPGGNATRPGDVVVSMSGQTIEILNTDAEGRLILADALTYAERFKPSCVIDVATLTGACVIALGRVASGLIANDDELANELLRSGEETGDRAWRLPMFDEYQDQLKSNFADMSNLGGRPAGAITAGCFLARFAKAYKWAHLDIAGTNALSGEAKGATGRPVPLLSEFLINRASRSSGAAA
ncbi:MAG TPA: leucyl aminopeptidase [Vicinamibacterales bacterium]|jgi:leucyl aminopeptidase